MADWGQTLNIQARTNEGYYEENYVLGENPTRGEINAYFLTVLVGHYLINTLDFTQKFKNYWNTGVIGIQIYAVANNYNLGLKVKFN